MELKEFITESLKQISDGLREGNSHINENGGGSVMNEWMKVSFDIAVTTSEEDKSGGGGKITIAQVFSAGADVENANKTTNYSRVQFVTQIHVNT